MVTIEHVRSRFIKHFDGFTGNIYAAPGRINLIGEHTDYNGGYVLPGAVDKAVLAELRPNGLNTIICYAIDMKDKVEFAVDDPIGPRTTWARYIYGVVQQMRQRGVEVKGFNAAFAGDVPLGAGMSSSAALESCFAYALNDVFGNNSVDKWELAHVGQATEHKYIGVNCGIMDQFASIFGRADKLMRLDCRSLEHEYFTFNPEGYRLVLLNSCVKHELAGSPYNDRRSSCERVVKAVSSCYPDQAVSTLRDCNLEQFEEVRADVSGEDYVRAQYVLKENERVLSVCEALKAGDYELVGRKMYETHEGLAHNYGVSCEEVDYLVSIACEEGVTGSRIMGGGFGGCTLNLVKEGCYDSFITAATEKYHARYGKRPLVIDVVIGEGARRIC